MNQQTAWKDEYSLSNLKDGQLIAQYINADINSESYAQVKNELERRRYHLEQIILKMNTRNKML
ncbi:MAG: hypothetical protein CVU50_09440 [Candidatus Cloacimonetes bacterium HGW-Cloacimonetes-3]|jgi:macrodomain Ter protein organizer (MatP/YcbG family)|nr:MAG: hypothetical protein CVU50_09440 [Candidatus Cloacimonetes bacterium HGW-Cloacimonetes-3]